MSNFWRYLCETAIFRNGLLWLSCLGYAYGALYSSIAEATAQQDLEVIRKQVTEDIKAFISPSDQDRYQIEVQNLDQRLRLSACDSGIATKLSRQSPLIGRQSVEVRCQGTKPWKIYLQVNVSAEIDVPVLKHALATGAVITESDIELKPMSLGANSSRPIIEDRNQLLGKKTKRHLVPGTPILVSQIEAPNLVERGQQVSLEYDYNGINVRMSGRSNQDGAEGDWIKVVNLNSGKTIEGRVNASGNVSVQN